jgi:hypothetical protein
MRLHEMSMTCATVWTYSKAASNWMLPFFMTVRVPGLGRQVAWVQGLSSIFGVDPLGLHVPAMARRSPSSFQQRSNFGKQGG